MDPVRNLPAVPGTRPVSERQPGKREADAFRRALGDQGDGTAAEREPEQPMRRGLQPRPRPGRNQEGTSMHVDVIA